MEIVEYPRNLDKGSGISKDMNQFFDEHVRGDHAGLNIQTWTVLVFSAMILLVMIIYIVHMIRMKRKRSYTPPAFV